MLNLLRRTAPAFALIVLGLVAVQRADLLPSEGEAGLIALFAPPAAGHAHPGHDAGSDEGGGAGLTWFSMIAAPLPPVMVQIVPTGCEAPRACDPLPPRDVSEAPPGPVPLG